MPVIEAESLSHRYGDTLALSPTSFSIPPGQICGYLGPNGAGKSTTMRILVGLQRPTAGTARLAGHDILQDGQRAKAKLGYVPESPKVYAVLTVREHFDLVGDLHEIEEAELARRASRFVELLGLEAFVDRRLDALSKGTLQKVVLVSALIHDPQVLILDEPLDGLDPATARAVKDLLRGLADQGRTVLFSSHVLEVVERIADRVIILDRGKIVLDENAAGLATRLSGSSLEELFRQLTAREGERDLAAALLETLSSGGGPG